MPCQSTVVGVPSLSFQLQIAEAGDDVFANVHKRILHTYQSVSHHQCHRIGVVGRCNMQSSSASSSYSAVQWCSSTAHYPVYELCKLSVIKQLHKQRGRPLLTN